MADLYLYDDILFTDGIRILTSGTKGARPRTPDKYSFSGSAEITPIGLYNGPDITNFTIDLMFVGDLSTWHTGTQCFTTKARPAHGNVGSGTCQLFVGTNMDIPNNLTFVHDSTNDFALTSEVGTPSLLTVQDDVMTSFFIDGKTYSVMFTPGDVPWSEGDTWTVSTRQALIIFSVDESTWSAQIPVSGLTVQGNEIEVWLTDSNGVVPGYGAGIRFTIGYDTTPFVVQDKFRLLCSYEYSWRNLINSPQSRHDFFRTRRDGYQVLLMDCEDGSDHECDMLTLFDHNLSDYASVKLKAIDSSDIKKCIGVVNVDPANPLILDVTVEEGLAANDMASGRLHICTGAAQGNSYSIVSNNAGVGCQITVSSGNDLVADGVKKLDHVILIHVDGSSIYDAEFSSGSGMASLTDDVYVTKFTTTTARAWIVLIEDLYNESGYFQMSFCRLGKSMIPTGADGNFACRAYIKDMHQCHISVYGITI